MSTVEEVHRTVPAMTTLEDGATLYDHARVCKHAIVEIGANAGASSCCLGLGSRDGYGVTVYSVDPHNGGGQTPDHQTISEDGAPGKGYINQGASSHAWEKNIATFNLQDIVKPIINYSELAIKDYPGDPIGLLFIDGDHRYNYVKIDLETWLPILVPDGWLFMHDRGYDGVSRCCKEFLSEYEEYDRGWFKKKMVGV